MSLAPVSIGTAVRSASGGGVTGLAYGRAPTDRRHTLSQVDARTRPARAGGDGSAVNWTTYLIRLLETCGQCVSAARTDHRQGGCRREPTFGSSAAASNLVAHQTPVSPVGHAA
jgi:hypothetical protein